MSDDKLIRLENFQRVVADRGYTPSDLGTKIGGRYTYWRDMLKGQKSFGEKIARKIEEKLNLPRMWLDHVGAPVPPDAAQGLPAQTDVMHLVAQLLHDLADTPERHRIEAVNAAISAVSTVRYGTRAEAATGEPTESGGSQPKKARQKA